MRVAPDKFLVEVNDQFVRPNIKGLEFIDTDFHPKALATKTGIIHTLPVSVGHQYKYDIKLNVGDEVVFNHLVCQKINKFSDKLFYCDYFNIFAMIVNDELVPLEEVIFCEKIVETDVNVGFFNVKGMVSDKCATVFHASKFAQEQGIRKGDIVFFTKNADYEIVVGGKAFYKMHLRNIIGIEREGVLTTFRNKLLVKDITELGSVGGFKKVYADTSLRLGVVIQNGTTDIEIGAKVNYYNSVASIVNWNDEYYGFIDESNIKYILPC